MAELRSSKAVGWGLLALGVTLGLALIASARVATEGLLEARRQNQTLEVKGFAEKRIDSDWAVWGATFTTRGASLEAAYATLESHRDVIQTFLTSRGVPEAEAEWMPVSTHAQFARDARGHITNRVDGYELSQRVEVSSANIDRIAAVSKGVSDLVKEGIELSSGSPQFFYTKLGELKIQMLAEATADARRRAGVLAEGSGTALGPLRSARQGVFQITPAHSTEVSNYGRNDTSSREKAIKAVVTMRYAID